MTEKRVGVLFVCLGNICRSPVAEGVFRSIVRKHGLEHAFRIDSAGTGAWHVGNPPDSRMQRTSALRGIPLDGIRARQFEAEDLASFDHILAMDKSNLHDILYLDEQDRFGHRARLFREFDPEPGDYQVPDPYYGGEDGFNDVMDIVTRTSTNLLSRLVDEYGLTSKA